MNYMKSLPDNRLSAVTGLMILLMSSVLFTVNCQEDTGPQPPVFSLVSINQTTGNTEMSWTPSLSPGVRGYIIYLYQNGDGFKIDSIFNPMQTTYSVYRAWSSVRSESFGIAAIADTLSPISNILKTIFCEAAADSCKKNIKVTWNKYTSFPAAVTGYDVLRSVNGGPFNIAGQTQNSDSIFVTDDYENGTEYCFAVRARLADGKSSYSNKACVTARITRGPDWINADYATVTESDVISLAFTIDPSSETDLFTLERKTGSSGSFKEIASIRTSVSTVTYIDDDGNPNNNNYYRLSAINSCNLPDKTSNIASNILLKSERGPDENLILKWNSYYKWNGVIGSCILYMDQGSGFFRHSLLNPSDTTCLISIPEVMFGAYGEKICFYIVAGETANPYGINGESRSNITCFKLEETITVPNIFTPNGDARNDLFVPVLTFTPLEYHLVISDRHGRVIFETRDFTESWDGSDRNNPPREDVYIWSLRVLTNNGNKISKTGTVTIYKNK